MNAVFNILLVLQYIVWQQVRWNLTISGIHRHFIRRVKHKYLVRVAGDIGGVLIRDRAGLNNQ